MGWLKKEVDGNAKVEAVSAEFNGLPDSLRESTDCAQRTRQPTEEGGNVQRFEPASSQRTDWCVSDVVEWLEALSLGHLGDRFRESGIDGAFLSQLTEEELVANFGLNKLQARKIQSRWVCNGGPKL